MATKVELEKQVKSLEAKLKRRDMQIEAQRTIAEEAQKGSEPGPEPVQDDRDEIIARLCDTFVEEGDFRLPALSEPTTVTWTHQNDPDVFIVSQRH